MRSTQVRLGGFRLAAVALRGQSEAGAQPRLPQSLGMSQTVLGLLLAPVDRRSKQSAVHHTASHIECDVGALQDVAQGN